MIKVVNLTKRFAGITAINNLNFEVERGEIVGFLGPNGAGKSTTMKILTSYLPATSGRASIAGYDVFEQSLEARRHLGYLPENTPLYQDMRVNEYLRYRANLKGVASGKVKERVGDVIELCNLKEVQRKLIGALSKGYRQRVGLADALVSDPDLLILDEPTIGLDPNQIRQVREVIKNLAQKRTVLISTHILPEVELMCSRVIVIHKGEIRASDTAENLLRNHRAAGSMRVEANTGKDDARLMLSQIAGVKDVAEEKEGDYSSFHLRLEANSDPGEEILRLASSRQWRVRELVRRRATLEDVFVELTHSDS
ncbi:MAG: ATP-binding cassette domain-containing protein [Verrucomicrobiota bacterium]